MANHWAQGWRWPQGIVNRILLALWSLLLALHVWELAGLAFLGRSHDLPRPYAFDAGVRCVLLAFVLALFLVPFSRHRYPLLLGAHVLTVTADLLHNTALWLPPPWLAYAPAAYGLLSCAGAALFVLALTRGERWDEFMLTAPLVLLIALFRLVRGDPSIPWPPTFDDLAGGESGAACEAPQTTEGG